MHAARGVNSDHEPAARSGKRTRLKPAGAGANKVIAGAAAAATAALVGSLVGSRFGAVGTVIGAAVGSVISTTAAAIYQRSIERARESVRSHAHSSTRHASDVTQVMPLIQPSGGPPVHTRRRRVLQTLGVAAVVFLIALLAVTAVEWFADRQIGGPPGTSVGGVLGGSGENTPTTEENPTTSPTTPTTTPDATTGSEDPQPGRQLDTDTPGASPETTASVTGTPSPTSAQRLPQQTAATPTP